MPRLLGMSLANVDGVGRLILANEGKLFVARVQPDQTLETTLLVDFDPMTFEPVPPTEWAKRWPWEIEPSQSAPPVE